MLLLQAINFYIIYLYSINTYFKFLCCQFLSFFLLYLLQLSNFYLTGFYSPCQYYMPSLPYLRSLKFDLLLSHLEYVFK